MARELLERRCSASGAAVVLAELLELKALITIKKAPCTP